MDIIEILKAIILGVIQGITEWLPISSTGHMILVNDFLPMSVYKDVLINKEFVDMFLVVIQLGSIFAVLLLFFQKLNPFKKDKEKQKETIVLWSKVAIAAVPAGIIGFLFDDLIDTALYNSLTVSIMLIVYGIGFLWVESRKKEETTKSLKTLSYKMALMIGVFQILALIPGTSRSGATILGAILLGCNRSVAAEFSFFLAIPMMFGASLLKLFKMKMVLDATGITILVVGMFTAFIVSIFAIKSLMKYIRNHDFKIFGFYRIVLGILIILMLGV
ncbi:MAG: undecaprenyl-diphosphate phosphatase [Anaerorhabdus sp.]